MARKANAPVGTCQCPVVQCTAEFAPLFRFATRAKDAKDARKAGKYYGRCPNHGWFGYDGAAGMQGYIRAHGKLSEGEKWETSEKPAGDASASSAPATAERPASVPASKPEAKPAASAPPKAPAVVPNPPRARAVVTPPAPKTRAPATDVWDL